MIINIEAISFNIYLVELILFINLKGTGEDKKSNKFHKGNLTINVLSLTFT